MVKAEAQIFTYDEICKDTFENLVKLLTRAEISVYTIEGDYAVIIGIAKNKKDAKEVAEELEDDIDKEF